MDFRYILFAVLLIPFATAEGLFSDERSERLEAGKSYAICKANFNIEVMKNHEEILGLDLEDQITDLESDIEELEKLVVGEGFWTLVKEKVRPHMKNSREKTVNGRINHGINMEERSKLREAHESSYNEFKNCASLALERYANAKISAYEKMLVRASSKADELESRGVDVSQLRLLIEQADDEVVEVLSEKIESDPAMHEAIRSVCMYNGCVNGTNFHFAAKWHVYKMEAIVELLDEKGADTTNATEHLENAKEILDNVKFGHLSSEDNLWVEIDAAADSIKEELSQLRSKNE